MKKVMLTIGFIAFAVGILLAVFFGIFPFPGIMDTVSIVLILLGLLVGVLNITAKETIPLLLATIALVVVGNVFKSITAFGLGLVLDRVLSLIATLMAPAAVIAAIRALVAIGFPKD